MTNVHEFYDPSTVEEEAATWLIKFDSDISLTAQERADFQEWGQRSALHQAAFKRYSKFWAQEEVLAELSIPQEQTAHNSKASVIARLLSTPWSMPQVGAFASVVLLTGTLMVSGLFNGPEITKNGIYGTLVGEQQSKTLSDGSVIQLNTDTLVQIDYSDNQRKIILLRGEAHFDVASNPDQPFEVYADNRMVRAVGTAFAVYLAEQDIEVTVSEGRVDLAALEPQHQTPTINNSVKTPPLVLGSLDAGQAASVDLTVADISQIDNLDAVALNHKLSWRTGQLTFAGDPLSKVVAEINRYTNIHIEIADPALNNLKVGGRFKIDDLEAIFDVLEVNFGMHVSRLNDRHIQLHQQPQPALQDE